MPEVYICYSKWNQKEAADITDLLEENSIKCWLLSRDINYARDWIRSQSETRGLM